MIAKTMLAGIGVLAAVACAVVAAQPPLAQPQPTSTAVIEPTVEPESEPGPPAQTTAVTQASAAVPTPADRRVQGGDAFSKLGQACPPDAKVEQDMYEVLSGVVCADGEVVGMYLADAYLDAPRGWDAGPNALADTVRVAVNAPLVWVQKKTCPRCRRVLGWTFQGDVSRMPEAELARLQRVAGRKSAPMTNASTWLRGSYLD